MPPFCSHIVLLLSHSPHNTDARDSDGDELDESDISFSQNEETFTADDMEDFEGVMLSKEKMRSRIGAPRGEQTNTRTTHASNKRTTRSTQARSAKKPKNSQGK